MCFISQYVPVNQLGCACECDSSVLAAMQVAVKVSAAYINPLTGFCLSTLSISILSSLSSIFHN